MRRTTDGLLLHRGAESDAPNHDGRTPVLAAAANGHFEVVKVLVGEGTDIAVANNDGVTPLRIAADNGHIDVAKFMSCVDYCKTPSRLTGVPISVNSVGNLSYSIDGDGRISNRVHQNILPRTVTQQRARSLDWQMMNLLIDAA
jgi:hypothetical protein